MNDLLTIAWGGLGVGVRCFFLEDLPFLPHLTIDSAQNECNNLDGP